MPSLINAYNRLPVTFDRGEGALVWDTQGNEYLDALGGIAVNALGHAHPAITSAICEQAAKLMHTANIYHIGTQTELGDKLCAIANMDKAFFCNSGAEANEMMVKIARLHARNRDIELPSIVVMENSFHGRTLATLSASGSRKVQAGFEPLVQGFVRVPYNDIESLRAVAEHNPHVVAVLVEPILGEGGIDVPDDDYLDSIREICDANDWLLMLDEVQTGMGRTGVWFAHQHSHSRPDVMSLAKALGNGFPIGACLARGAAAELIQPGNHGSTFGGNPLACRVGCAVIDTIETENLVARAGQLGLRILDGLEASIGDLAGVVDIRGSGLMIGVELDRDCPELVARALDARLLINVTQGSVIRLLPAYIISDAQADDIVSGVADLVREFLSG